MGPPGRERREELVQERKEKAGQASDEGKWAKRKEEILGRKGKRPEGKI